MLTSSETEAGHQEAADLERARRQATRLLVELGHRMTWAQVGTGLYHGVCRRCGRAVAVGLTRGAPLVRGQLLAAHCTATLHRAETP